MKILSLAHSYQVVAPFSSVYHYMSVPSFRIMTFYDSGYKLMSLPSFLCHRECGGIVVECQTPNREVLGSIPTDVKTH